MNILTHYFKETRIDQVLAEVSLGSRQVPAGYVNATQLCKAHNKKLNDWSRLKRSTLYLEALSGSAGIPADQLLIGNESEGTNEQRGTWVHPEVAVSIATWISPEFEVWANRTLRAVINGDFTPLTADAAIAQQKIQELWDELRADTKELFWMLTDAIRDTRQASGKTIIWLDYALPVDAINKALFGKTAKQIHEELGTSKSTANRDNYGRKSLRRIANTQESAALRIQRGADPLDAITDVIRELGYSVINFRE